MLLEESPPFNDATVAMIESFLRQYQTPIALVAHNGFLFDFPILRRQLVRSYKIFIEQLSYFLWYSIE